MGYFECFGLEEKDTRYEQIEYFDRNENVHGYYEALLPQVGEFNVQIVPAIDE